MRIPSGSTDRYIYFVAVDATDLKTRETGQSTWTVYRSRNGGVAAAMTTPTINETDVTNMPGVYELLCDEDTTVTAGNDTEEMVFHITHTGMHPVTRTIELYRPETTEGSTLAVTATGAGGIDWGNVENKTTANDLSGTDIQLADTATNLTNLPSIPANWLTAAGINAGALNGKGDWALATLFTGITSVAEWLGLMAGKQAANATALTEIKATGAGSGTYDEATHSLEATRDHIGNGTTLTEAGGTGDHLTALPNQTMDITGNLIGNVTGSVGSNLELGPAEVNAEVDNALTVTTYGEPAKGAPGATISLKDKIGFLYKAWRNKTTQTATTLSLFNDDTTTVDHDATVSDAAGTATRGEMTDGP